MELSIDPLVMLLTAAVVVESIVKIVENIQIKQTDWRYWSALILGLAGGITVALAYDLDLFQLLGFESQIPFIGAVLTGFLIGRGSNYIADIFKAIGVRKA